MVGFCMWTALSPGLPCVWRGMQLYGSKSLFSTKALETVLRGSWSSASKYPETTVCTLSKPLLVMSFLPAYVADKWKCYWTRCRGKGLVRTIPWSHRPNGWTVATICGGSTRHRHWINRTSACAQLVLSNKKHRLGVRRTKIKREQSTSWRKHEAKNGLIGIRCGSSGWLADVIRSDQTLSSKCFSPGFQRRDIPDLEI